MRDSVSLTGLEEIADRKS